MHISVEPGTQRVPGIPVPPRDPDCANKIHAPGDVYVFRIGSDSVRYAFKARRVKSIVPLTNGLGIDGMQKDACATQTGEGEAYGLCDTSNHAVCPMRRLDFEELRRHYRPLLLHESSSQQSNGITIIRIRAYEVNRCRTPKVCSQQAK
jgi:hypothetical protein